MYFVTFDITKKFFIFGELFCLIVLMYFFIFNNAHGNKIH